MFSESDCYLRALGMISIFAVIIIKSNHLWSQKRLNTFLRHLFISAFLGALQDRLSRYDLAFVHWRSDKIFSESGVLFIMCNSLSACFYFAAYGFGSAVLGCDI